MDLAIGLIFVVGFESKNSRLVAVNSLVVTYRFDAINTMLSIVVLLTRYYLSWCYISRCYISSLVEINMKAILYYVHDPMCSWCWGFSSTLTKLLDGLPNEIEIKRLLGGLSPDSGVPMPESMQQSIKSNWSRIEDMIPNVKFNFDFWQKTVPRRSTYPACRAVIAARQQGLKYDVQMTKAIQQAYYQEARNPSDNSTLIEIAAEINLSTAQFEKDLLSSEINNSLIKEIALSRELYVESYPSLVLQSEDNFFSIKVNYNNSEVMQKQIQQYL